MGRFNNTADEQADDPAPGLRVLLVEDDPASARLIPALLSEDLEGRFLEPVVVGTLGDALAVIDGETDLDCILLDLNLPDSGGIETVEELVRSGTDLPVVATSAADDDGLSLQLIKVGAQDFVPKEFSSGERMCRTIVHSIERKRFELELRNKAYRDPLTGLLNHAATFDVVARALANAKRRDRQVSAVYVDLDNFKQLNDNFGHRTGDAVLVEVAKRLDGCVRDTDVVGRLGGDEFVVVTSDPPNAPTIGALLPKIRGIFTYPVEVDGVELSISGSVGGAIQPAGDHDLAASDLLDEADRAMYRTKNRFSRA